MRAPGDLRLRSLGDLNVVWPLLALSLSATAQDPNVPLPPRILDDPVAAGEPARSGALPPQFPDRTRLAEAARDRDPPDEIVVIGGSQWRLPDLGSSWREEREAEEDAAARIDVSFFPLYDPERPIGRSDLFLVNREQLRQHGTIEVFRLRFGRRPRD